MFTCAATDRDSRAPFNTIAYEMVLLDNTAGQFFDVQPDGDIVLTRSVLTDNIETYQVRSIQAWQWLCLNIVKRCMYAQDKC